MHFDVIVIGAGSMGMAAGYFLSKSGKKTLLIDSFAPPHNRGSHHGETRIIRYAYGEGKEYVPMIIRAKELWEDLEKETGRNLFLPTGVINVGTQSSSFIQNILDSAVTYSLPLEVMDAEQVNKRWAGMKLPSEFIGCYEPTSGVLKCEECIDAYRELAEKHGATILTNHEVKDISVQEKSVTISTATQNFTADSLVITAGAWSSKLLARTGLSLPIQPIRKTFAWFQTDEHTYNENEFPAFSFETPQGIYYGFPSIEGAGLKLGRHDGGELINPDQNRKEFGEVKEDTDDLMGFLNKYMPNDHVLNYGKTCMYTMTPDENFVIDLHPEYSHIAIATGFSGHGFKFSSAVGQILSELIIDGSTELDLTPFAISRFKDNRV